MEGHNKTEIGIFPNDWNVGRIDDFFEIQQGKQVSKSNRIGENQKQFLRTSNIYWGKIAIEELDYMNFSEDEEAKYQLEKNDLLVCEGGDIGRTAIWNQEVENCYYQNHLHRLRAKTDDIDPLFILQWLEYSFVYGKVYFGRANVTTIPNLSKSRLSELILPHPPLPEQRKIAHVLTKVQKAIEQQDKLIRTTTELKKALMQKLFTEGTRGESLKETEIGLVPESWEVAELGDICERVSINVEPKKDGNIPYAGLEHINPGRLRIYNWGYENEIISSKSKFKKNEILYGKLRPYLDKAVIASFEGICSTDILVFTGKNEIENEFLIHLFHTEKLVSYANSTTTGVQHPRTSWSSLKRLEIALPDKDERTEIAKSLNSLEDKIEILEKKKQTLTDLFKTLLHELMTGQRRVHELEFDEINIKVN
ncbi:MAG: restriction endonuclease subunit S [Methanosarcinales archaeon]|nr:restriction endonuclease subunit S [Methanosarcinales archaeon]